MESSEPSAGSPVFGPSVHWLGRWVPEAKTNWAEYLSFYGQQPGDPKKDAMKGGHVWHFERMSADGFQILQQLPARDGFQLRYSVAVDGTWHPLPPPLAAAGRQSFAANIQQQWLHAWTPKGLLTKQHIVSPAGEEGFQICTCRWLTGADQISSRTEILNPQGTVAAWLGGTWKRKSEHTGPISLTVLRDVKAVRQLQQQVALLPDEINMAVVQMPGVASVDDEIAACAVEVAKALKICVLVVGDESGGVMVDGDDVLGAVGVDPVVFDSTCGRIGCGQVHQKKTLLELMADVQVVLSPTKLSINCSQSEEIGLELGSGIADGSASATTTYTLSRPHK